MRLVRREQAIDPAALYRSLAGIVDPVPGGTRVTIRSVFRLSGVLGALAARSLPTKLEPVYVDELARLERYVATRMVRETDRAVA